MVVAYTAIYRCETTLVPELLCKSFRLVEDLKGTFRIPDVPHRSYTRKANIEFFPPGLLALRLRIQRLEGLLVKTDGLRVGIAPGSLVPRELQVITGLAEVLRSCIVVCQDLVKLGETGHETDPP